jgi:hypothetical protein
MASPNNTTKSLKLVRRAGIAGMSGAILLIVGDILFTSFAPSAGQDLVTVRAQVAPWRSYTSGVLGIVGSWLYTLGSWHVYFALRPAGKTIAAIAFGAFAAMMISTGAYHAAFVSQMFGARVARLAGENGEVANVAVSLPETYQQILTPTVIVTPGIVFTALFTFALLLRSTRYPRWFILLNPMMILLLFWLVGAVVALLFPRFLSGPLYGNIYNIGLFLFFAVSTILLWNGGRIVASDPSK